MDGKKFKLEDQSAAGVRSIAHFIYYFCAHDVRVAVLHCKIAK